LVLLLIVYNLSSTKLEIRAKQFLPGSEGVVGRGKWWGALYAHMNKRYKKRL
jgi:hypothetical protein